MKGPVKRTLSEEAVTPHKAISEGLIKLEMNVVQRERLQCDPPKCQLADHKTHLLLIKSQLSSLVKELQASLSLLWEHCSQTPPSAPSSLLPINVDFHLCVFGVKR